MNRKAIWAIALLTCAASTQASAQEKELHCTLKFSTKEWSAIYESAKGSGTVSCDNGKSIPVGITAKGVGLTAGKWKVEKGIGKFTHVHNIEETLGSYLSVSGEAGLFKAGTVDIMAKKNVALALAGKGSGFDIAVDVSDFKISKSEAKK